MCPSVSIEGELLQLRTRYNDENYIISDRLGNEQAITANGKHYGVEVRGLVSCYEFRLHNDFAESFVTRGLSPLPVCVLDN
jgi:hypothetical protein